MKTCCTWGGRLCMMFVGFFALIMFILGTVGLSDCPSYDAAEGVYVFFVSMAQGWTITFIGIGILSFGY